MPGSAGSRPCRPAAWWSANASSWSPRGCDGSPPARGDRRARARLHRQGHQRAGHGLERRGPLLHRTHRFRAGDPAHRRPRPDRGDRRERGRDRHGRRRASPGGGPDGRREDVHELRDREDARGRPGRADGRDPIARRSTWRSRAASRWSTARARIVRIRDTKHLEWLYASEAGSCPSCWRRASCEIVREAQPIGFDGRDDSRTSSLRERPGRARRRCSLRQQVREAVPGDGDARRAVRPPARGHREPRVVRARAVGRHRFELPARGHVDGSSGRSMRRGHRGFAGRAVVGSSRCA